MTYKTNHHQTIAKATILAIAAALLALVFASSALAGLPTHLRKEALEITTGLNQACGVAADSEGDLYVSSAGTDEIKVYDPTHALLASVANANEPCGLAVNSKGELFVSEQASGEVVRYKPNAYPFAGPLSYGSREVIDASGDARGIAVDRFDDRLYVAEGDHIAAYAAGGSFEANVAAGKLTDATGVGAYTHIAFTNGGAVEDARLYLSVADAQADEAKVFSGKEIGALKLRKTISGVDQDGDPTTADQEFGFGTAGAYLGADPGNEEAEVPHGCVQVAEQACTAGHFFLYDAAHNVIDEFDATGEYLDQFTSAALADAKPTQVAVERSGGANDGTVYASAGDSAGARVLAFGPLVSPARQTLEAPLSHVLAKAISVATDFHGNVYAAAETKIKVFSPEGNELTSFEDAGNGNANDLAVDSECNVYVIDGFNTSPTQKMTYYDASSCPPTPATTYTRHAPALIGAGPGMLAVTVNPANDHVFVYGTPVFASGPIIELKSAAEGSAEVGKCGAGLGIAGSRLDIDVYGKTGDVYVTSNARHVYVGQCGAEEERLLHTRGNGCPNGEFGANPSIAVDQSNGHVVEFSSLQPGGMAREYDSAGSCVAEFGEFSTGGNAYKVAIDNSCAIHDPPLTEQTTPTCAEFDPSYGNAYVAFDSPNAEQPHDVTAFGPLSYGEAPTAVTGVASGITSTSASLNGTVDPRGFLLEECKFEYLTDAQYLSNGKTFAGASSQACAESPAMIGNGSKPVPVHAEVSGLAPESTRYRYRLAARNKFGEIAGNHGLFGPPLAVTETASSIGYDEAVLRARIDPSGLATTYHFEYGTAEGEYDQSTPDASLPPGDGYVTITAPASGLAEETEYHFRIVAENEASTVPGSDQSFETRVRRHLASCSNTEYRTGLSANLPDCRAYELVTPAETRGIPPVAQTSGSGQPYANSWFVQPRGKGAGESLAYIATLPGFDGTGRGDGFRAQRGEGAHPAEGWTSELYGFSFAQVGGDIPGRHGISADQRYWFWDVLAIAVPAEETFPVGNYMRTPSGQADRECSPEPKPAFELGDPGQEFELVGCGSLGTDLKAEGRFVSASGTHVIFTSDEQLEEEAAPPNTETIYDRPAGGAEAEVVSVKPDGSAFGAGENATYIAATEDGSVVFKVGGVLYLHRGGTTTEIAAAPNTFAGVSEGGERVFYVDAAIPLAVQVPPPAGLWACDVETGPCAGPGAHAATEIAPNAVFVNVSADGSNAFFTSEEVLAGTEPNENGEEAEGGEPNLYVWDGTDSAFVAILNPKDLKSFTGENEFTETEEDLGQWIRAIPGQGPGAGIGRAFSPTRSTPDGEVLVFQSHAQLTSYENEEHGEIYRYAPAAETGAQLRCVSCDPSNAPNPPGIKDALLQSYQPGGATNTNTLIPNVTDDGEEVFFQSRVPLLPEDANSVTDVYEWKAKGAGEGSEECKRAAGCLALISSGQGETPSYLYGMSADGHDVFFQTIEKLVGADVTGSPSMYDARVDGGIPDPPPAEVCHGDACQPLSGTPPQLANPNSGAEVSDGNVPPKPRSCPKGKRKVRRAGKVRCLAPRHSKRHRNRGHHRANHDRGAHR